MYEYIGEMNKSTRSVDDSSRGDNDLESIG